jgi:glycosyltransferase involved in cell wall biosynthesis
MGLKICFFVTSPYEQFLQEQYTYTDYKILKDLGHDVKFVNKFSDIPFGYDLYYSWWASGSFLPLIKAKLSNKPIITIAGGTEALFYFDSATNKPQGYLAAPWYKKVATRITLRFSDIILVVSDFMINDVRTLGGKNIVVVHNCVDTDRFINQNNYDEREFITSIFRLEANAVQLKRGEELIKAIPYVVKQYPTQKFMIIGAKEDAYEKLLNLAKDLGVENNINFTGNVNNTEIPLLLNKSKIYVQISDTESFGVAIAEAMSCGIPIVCSDRGAINEVVGNLGVYVDNNNPMDIANGILSLMNYSDKETTDLGIKLRERILNNFSIEHRKNKLIQIIKKFYS